MSKKLEAIKKDVFFAKENPEALATLIAGLVTDVVTSVKVEGAVSINIPESDSVTEDYVATALSQYGDLMSDSVTLSLNEAVDGVSISGNTITVASTVEADSFVLKAVCGAITTLTTVTLVASN